MFCSGGSEVTSVPAPAVDRALQGKVPGAYIQQNSGAPGGGTQTRAQRRIDRQNA